jgi:hypothetical protein
LQLANEINDAGPRSTANVLKNYGWLLNGWLLNGWQGSRLFHFLGSKQIQGYCQSIENDIDMITEQNIVQLPAGVASLQTRLKKMRDERKLRDSKAGSG